MIKKILVSLDGSINSFRGLDEAIIIAKNGYCTITGIYVTPLSPPTSEKQKEYIRNYLLRKTNKFMKKAEIRCTQNKIQFHTKILHGNIGPKIVKFEHDRDFDLIILGSRGRGSIKEVFLGSTSNYVIHKTKIPVMIVK